MKDNTPKTAFQGAISLDAIFAATSKKNSPEIKKDIKLEKPAEAKKLEEEEEGAEIPAPLKIPEPVKAAEEVKSEAVTGETDSFKTAQRLIQLGLLDDFTIQTADEDEDGTLVSQFTSMTSENLEEIINIHKQGKTDEISSKYITKEGLKEHQLKVIEILKNGGDLSKIAGTEEEAFKRPFEGFDMEEQERQIDVLYTDLTVSKKLSHDRAINLIKISISSGTIALEAQEVFDSYRRSHSEYVDKMLEDQKKDKEFIDLTFKENKKALTEKLKNAGLKETVYKKVTSEYSKKNENGEYALVDKLKAILDNPEDNHELILHLVDKNLFNETFKIKSAQEAQKTIVRLASGAQSKGNRQSSKTEDQTPNTPWMRNAQIYNEGITQK
jgi:riboflavin synthase